MWAHDIAGEFVNNEFLSNQGENLRVEECMFTPAAWDATSYSGNRIALPFAAECPALIYNEDVLDEMGREPPETFEEWTSIMEEYNDPENGQYGLSHPLNAYFSSWATQAYGADIYNGEEDELGITSQDAIDGMNIILEDLKPYMPSDPSEQAQMAVFEDGNSPFAINGPWAIAGLEDAGLNINVTRIPAPGDAESRPYSGIQMLFFSKKMNNGGNSARAAREFSEWYVTNIERAFNLINNSSYIPVQAGLSGSDALPEAVRGYAQQFETGYPMPQNPKMGDVWVPYETNLLDAFNSGNDPAPLMESAAEEIRNSWNQ
jgi:arabinogalactan oligomer/maltooligosaccharide transport system substrate-binding protein